MKLTLIMLIGSIACILMNAWVAGNCLDMAIQEGNIFLLPVSGLNLWLAIDIGTNIRPLTAIYIMERKMKK